MLFNLFKKKKDYSPKENARDRLRLILIHDRVQLSPEILTIMREEILNVISRYVDVDQDELEIRMTQVEGDDYGNSSPALVANIPIKGIKKR
ncbi:MAG: cell division topological specificity factor MinE [Oscillospiraceae bacterium]|nr:cell division topological specificity factor MinE [Oscillospiraceae bacterium]